MELWGAEPGRRWWRSTEHQEVVAVAVDFDFAAGGLQRLQEGQPGAVHGEAGLGDVTLDDRNH